MRSLFCLTFLFAFVHGYTLMDMERLKQHLFSNYSTETRPVYNQSATIEVYVTFSLRSVIQFDMSNGQLDTMAYMIAFWTDERMIWAGTEFDDVPYIGLNGDKLWHPHIAQIGAMADEVQLTSATLFKDGTVMWVMIRKYYTFCTLDMRYYPNDQHECTFEFMSIKYSSQQVKLISEDNGVDVTLNAEHGEWAIKRSSAQNIQLPSFVQELTVESLHFNLIRQRQSSFNIIHTVIPLAVLAVSTLFVHVIPLNCGERISYSVTLLLAYVFWQSLVAEELPKNSARISISSMVITGLLCTAGFFTILSGILCRISILGEDRTIPEFLQKLVRVCRPKRKRQVRKFQRQDSTFSDIYGKEYGQASGLDNRPKVINRSTSSHSADFVENPRPVSWMEVANTIDRIFFVVHIVLAIVAFAVYVMLLTV